MKKLVYATERFFHICFLLGLNYFLMHSATSECCQGYENIFLENWQFLDILVKNHNAKPPNY